jgi:stress response protein SCP2
MQKGDCIIIPPDLFRAGEDFFVGLGWTCPGDVDLDASIVVATHGTGGGGGGGKAVNVVGYKDLQFGGAVVHQGDNMTGGADGDDERINIDLDAMPPEVPFLVTVVSLEIVIHVVFVINAGDDGG